MLGLHKHALDFDVYGGHNIRTFLLVDESDYMETPENPLYKIIVPGFTATVTIGYIPNQVTVINSNLLQISCSGTSDLVRLPDGIYQVTQQIGSTSADTLTRYRSYLRTNELQEKYDKLLQRLELSDYGIRKDRQLKENIILLDILMQSAIAETYLCNDRKAIDKYHVADRLADKLLNVIKYK